MKTRVTLILFCAILAFTQNSVFAQDFLVSREDTSCDFSHSNPVVFPDGSNGFLVVWQDTRNGPPQYYAQQFDSLAQPIGSNFPIYSDMDVIYGPAGSFLVENSEWVTYGASVPQFDTYYVKARLCNTDGTSSEPVVLVQARQTAIDCIGVCIGYSFDLVSMSSGYVNGLNFGGTLGLSKRDWNGNVVWSWYNPTPAIYPDTVHSTGFSICSNSGDYLAAVWVNVRSLDPFADTTHQIMGTFFDKNGDTIATNVMLRAETPSQFDLDWWRNERVRVIALSDSLYEIFDYDADAFTLHYWTVDTAGIRVGEIHDLVVFHDGNTSNYRSTQNFGLTPIVNGRFALLLTVRENIEPVPRHYNTLLTFDTRGNPTGGPVTDSTSDLAAGNDFFMLPDSTLVIPVVEDSDVYLGKFDKLSLAAKAKMNDNSAGSNDMLAASSPLDSGNFFVTWTDEKNSFGRKIGNDGVPAAEPRKLPTADLSFFSNGYSIGFWRSMVGDSTYVLGYDICNESLSIVRSDTLAASIYSDWLFGAKQTLPDSSFIILYRDGSALKLRHEWLNGRYKEITVPGATYPWWLKIEPVTDSTFLIGYNGQVATVSENLEFIGGTHSPGEYSSYLGDNKFLKFTALNFVPGTQVADYYGTIVDQDAATLVGNFTIDDSIDNVTSLPLPGGYFAVAYRKHNQLFLRTYDTSGTARIEPLPVSSDPLTPKTGPLLSANENSLLVSWSEARTAGKGYDVYGRVFEIDKLTPVKLAKHPVPLAFSLYQNYPNPFNPATVISYDLPAAARVTLGVYDILGRKVATLVDAQQNAGVHKMTFDGARFASGVYFYRIVAHGQNSRMFVAIKKMLLVK